MDQWAQPLLLLYCCFLPPFHSSEFLFLCWFCTKFDNMWRISCKISTNYWLLQGTSIEHSLIEEMMRTLCLLSWDLFWCDPQKRVFDCTSSIIPGLYFQSDYKTITLWSTVTWECNPGIIDEKQSNSCSCDVGGGVWASSQAELGCLSTGMTAYKKYIKTWPNLL